MVTNTEESTQKILSHCRRIFYLIIHCAVVEANYSSDNEMFLPTKHGGGLSITIRDRVPIFVTVANSSENIIKVMIEIRLSLFLTANKTSRIDLFLTLEAHVYSQNYPEIFTMAKVETEGCAPPQ